VLTRDPAASPPHHPRPRHRPGRQDHPWPRPGHRAGDHRTVTAPRPCPCAASPPRWSGTHAGQQAQME